MKRSLLKYLNLKKVEVTSVNLASCPIFFWSLNAVAAGEVSDSDDGGEGDSDSMVEFDDGLGEDLIRDEEDRKRLEQMTEKEREQELFNRIEKREVLMTRSAFP